MNEIDHLQLNGHLLQTLLAVVETGGVTAAALRLGLTQSAVSHQLDTLRAITGDALFVKSGRGIAATEHAIELAVQARSLLDSMAQFSQPRRFDPAAWQGTFTIAANDFQRDVLLPALMQGLHDSAPHLTLRVVPSGVPTLEMLREQRCDLVISPRPPDGADIVQKRLFEDDYRVFYDPRMRQAPRDRSEYLAAEHITVVYESQRSLDLDQWMAAQGIERRFRVMVPGFAGLAPFIQGSALLATVPGLLQAHLLQGLASAEVPVACPTMPMYLIWHRRSQQDAAHRWMRAQIEAVVGPAISRASQARGTAPRGDRVRPAPVAGHRAGRLPARRVRDRSP
jgi:DNA-binding transcriptional LysR family regulator